MKDAIQWRIAITQQIAELYQVYEEVAIVLTVGSLANDFADQFSDLDLVIYWHTAPTMAQRKIVAEKMRGFVTEMSQSPPETDPAQFMWEDVFYVGGERSTGLKIDLNHVLLTGLAKMINDVIIEHEHNYHKYVDVYSLKRSYVHFGEDILASYIDQIAECPLVLSEKIIRDYLKILPKSSYKMLASRADWLFYNQIMTRASEAILFMLYGLNRDFPPVRFKHIYRLPDELTLKPANLLERLTFILRGDPSTALETLTVLINETYDLIDIYFPQIDTSSAREWFNQGRAELFEAPKF